MYPQEGYEQLCKIEALKTERMVLIEILSCTSLPGGQFRKKYITVSCRNIEDKRNGVYIQFTGCPCA